MDLVTRIMSFVRVVDSGGFAAAARALDLSPSVVTNHIQSLEERLGVRLLNRTTRKVNLTEVGQAYYERYVRVIAELEEADHLAEALQSEPRGTLRLNTSPGTAVAVAPAIGCFMTNHPEVSIDLVATSRMVDLVEEAFDLAIRGHAVPDSSLIIRRLATYRQVVCGAPEYLARRGTPERPQDLVGHNCVHFSNAAWNAREWRFTQEGKADQTVTVKGNLMVNNFDSLRLAALLGQGLIQVPIFLVSDELNSKRLIPVLTDFPGPEMPINAVYPHRQFVPVKVRRFIDLVIENFHDATWKVNKFTLS
jgi:DNA-binding transcriptional LysR family regulator